MSLGQIVATNLPFLRRYARALPGSQSAGDAFVRATLEAALEDARMAREESAALAEARAEAEAAAAKAAEEMATIKADLERSAAKNDELSSKVSKAVKKGKGIEAEKKRLELWFSGGNSGMRSISSRQAPGAFLLAEIWRSHSC